MWEKPIFGLVITSTAYGPASVRQIRNISVPMGTNGLAFSTHKGARPGYLRIRPGGSGVKDPLRGAFQKFIIFGKKKFISGFLDSGPPPNDRSGPYEQCLLQALSGYGAPLGSWNPRKIKNVPLPPAIVWRCKRSRNS